MKGTSAWRRTRKGDAGKAKKRSKDTWQVSSVTTPKKLKERSWSFQMHYIQTFKIESDNHFLEAVVVLLCVFTTGIY